MLQDDHVDWHKRFRDGRVDISNDLLPGRPHISHRAKSVQDAILEGKRRSVKYIADITRLSLGNMHYILTTQLEMNMICAQCVPHMLTSD